MYTLPSSPIDRNVALHATNGRSESFPPDLADKVIGTDSMGADVYVSNLAYKEETDAEWLVRIEREEARERHRIETTYFPTLADLAEFEAWLADLNDTLPEDGRESCYTVEEWDAVRRGQVSVDELAMLAAGMPVG